MGAPPALTTIAAQGQPPQPQFALAMRLVGLGNPLPFLTLPWWWGLERVVGA